MADGLLKHDGCTLVAKPHPFSSDVVYAQVTAGMTIADMLGDGTTATCGVTIDGHEVPRALWGRVKPKAGRSIHVTVYPQGGNGGGGKWLRLVLLVVLIVVTYGYGATAAGAFGVTDAAGVAAFEAGMIAVGTLAIHALVPPPTAKGLGAGGGDPFQQLNSLTGTSNRAAPYGVVPCVVGTMRFFPPHAALPYTEISGDDQYLRMLLDLGMETTPGSLDISDIRIGETDIATYDDVEWQISSAPTLFTQDIFELAVGASLTAVNDAASRTTQAASTEISLDIIFGSGLFGVDDKGYTVTGTCVFAVQYRPTGSGMWLDIGAATGLTFTGGMKATGGNLVSVSSSKRKTLRCGIRWTISSGQYDVRITRGAASFPGASAAGKVGDAVWSVLRSINPQNPSTTGTLKLAVRIKATDQLNGVVQNLSVLASQKVRRWDATTATWLTPVASTNPAWLYLWLMTQCPAVIRRLDDLRMDIDGVAAWADECTAKGLSAGFVMDSGRAFFSWVMDVLAAGRASFGLRNSKYSAIRDIAQTVPVQMFTPGNSWGFSFTKTFSEPPHALRVTFTNPEANYQKDVRVVYADGYTAANATRFEELDLSMIIDPDAAWRMGRYHLSVIINRPNQYTLQADIEHLVCERGDLIHVAHDVTGWGVAWGRVKAVSGTTITLDGLVTLEAGKTYALRIRADDGTQQIQNITTAAGDTAILTVAAAMTGVQQGDLFVVGEVTRGVAALVVRKVEPSDDLTATITAIDAAPAVWTADSGTPPTFVSDITGKAWCAAPAPPIVHIRAGDTAPDDAGVIKAVTGVSSDNPQGGIFRFVVHSGGGGCVVTESYLPDMRQAGDVKVGDTIAMADPKTLGDRVGTATYSEPVMQPCVELITETGAVLRCSISAPIPTEHDGIVLAPHVAGKRVAVRDGNGTRWERVASLRGIGPRLVQHISVDDGCFWAGAEQGRYVLHHNKLPTLSPDSRIDRNL